VDAPDILPIAPGPGRSVRPLEMAGSRFAIIQDPLLAVMRILVIEDETKVGCFIKRALEEESYAVDLCEDGAKGLEMALTTNYDSIIVDLMLPSLSGLEIVKGIRRERIQTPILI
jgi:CheY-like chemotaxis protein